MDKPEFSEEAVHIWDLQNAAEAAIALATMGTTTSPAAFIARQDQADSAREKYRAALEAATGTPVFDEYLALLRFRHENGMR